MLAGTGSLAGTVAVSGTLDPGGTAVGAIGTMKVGGLTFGGSGVLNVDLGATASDKITVAANGNATLSGGTLNIASTSLPIGSFATILQTSGTGTISGTFSGLANGASISLAGNLYEVNYLPTLTAATSVTLTFVQSPVITTPNIATFTFGVTGQTFTLAASGTTPIKYTVTSGSLSGTGFTLSSGGVLDYVPGPGTLAVGSYPLTITAKNGGVPDDQSFTLNVYGFTSASSTSVAVGAPASFTMATADGSAPATISLANTDVLPTGVTFSNGVFSGTPLAGSVGTYTLHADASDGVDPDALQTFTLTVAPSSLVYVSSANFGQASAPNVGDSVDGDQGTAGTQAALFGATALTSIAGALSNIASAGTVLVNAGTYAESPNLTFGGTFRISGNVTVNSVDSATGTTIDLQGNSLTTGDNAGDNAIAGPIVGTGGLIKVGSDALTLSANDSYTGTTTVSAGTLIVNGSLASSIVNVASGGTLRGSGTLSGAVSLAAGSVLAPGMSQNLTTGTLNTGNLSFTTGSTFATRLIGSLPAGYDHINVTGSVNLDALSSGGATLNVTLGQNTFSPGTVFVLINNDGTDPVTGFFQTPSGTTLHNGDLFTVGTSNFRIYYTGGDGNDVVLVEADTPSTVYVSNSNFGLGAAPSPGQSVDGDQGAGGTQAAVFGVNAFASLSGALATVASAGAVLVNAGTYAETPNLTNGVTLRLTGGNVTVNAIDSAVGTTIDLQGNQLITGVATGNDTLAGVLQGSGGLTKTGSDTLTLSGADTYSGGTTVAAGSLLVDGSLSSSSTVSIAANAILAGTGTVAGAISSAGIVSPGDTAGATATLSTGSLTLGPGSLNIDLTSTAAYDSIVSTGAVTLTGAALNLSAVVGNINDTDQFTIVTGTSISGTFNGGSIVTVGSRQFSITYNATSVVLTAQSGSAPTIVSTVQNGGIAYVNSTLEPAQHSMVENIVYSFSSAVSLSASNFSIIGLPGSGTTIVPTLNVSGNNGNGASTVWTVTFTGAGVNPVTNSIGDGEYRLSLTGVSGLADSSYDFFRLLGDMDGTGLVNIADFNTVVGTFLRATNDPAYLGAADLDGDNAVGISDINLLIGNFLHSVPQPLPH